MLIRIHEGHPEDCEKAGTTPEFWEWCLCPGIIRISKGGRTIEKWYQVPDFEIQGFPDDYMPGFFIRGDTRCIAGKSGLIFAYNNAV
jgi:hypothetical protein